MISLKHSLQVSYLSIAYLVAWDWKYTPSEHQCFTLRCSAFTINNRYHSWGWRCTRKHWSFVPEISCFFRPLKRCWVSCDIFLVLSLCLTSCKTSVIMWTCLPCKDIFTVKFNTFIISWQFNCACNHITQWNNAWSPKMSITPDWLG